MFVKDYDLSFIKEENPIIKTKKYIIENCEYKILKYNKNYLNHDNLNKEGLIRSVILINDKLVCYSLPKSLDISTFLNQNFEKDCIAEELVEGTMINLYYNFIFNKWEIATKSSIGGKIKYFKDQPTFNELFFDICKELNIELNQFNSKYSYSFVMHHPKNKFIIPIKEKRLYLISVFEINKEEFKVKEVPKIKYSELDLPPNLSFPYAHYINNFQEILNYYCSMNTNMLIMGIVIRNINGDRIKIRNPNYEYLKTLKGNNPKLQYQYLNLYKNNKIKEYLYYFPDKKEIFGIYKKILYQFTDTLYQNYINCYIKHNQELKDFPYEYRSHMYKLHQIYLTNITSGEENFYINKKNVISYLKSLDESYILYSINYHLRTLEN